MESFFSEEYFEFYSRLTEKTRDVLDVRESIRDAVCFIAPKLGIGAFVVDYDIQAAVYSHKRIQERFSYYENPNGYGDDFIEKCFSEGDNEKIIFHIFPEAGKYFSDTDRINILGVVKNVYMTIKFSLLKEYVKNVSARDTLTGLLNTTGIAAECAKKYMRGQNLSPYAAIFFNIRNFKFINQTAGAKTGDIILKDYSLEMTKQLLEDEQIARLGGDNFFALVRKERADDFINDITFKKLQINVNGNIMSYDIETKIGLYFIKPKDNFGDALNCASAAFQYARVSNKYSCVWFKPHMIKDSMRAKEISNRFREAMNEEKFKIFYQPKVSLDNDCLCGSEALVRWAEDDGIIQPGEFIPVLEKEGTVRELDYYNLKHVCKDIREWLDAGIEPVRVSVNFSKIHLYNHKLENYILNTLEEYKVDPKYIEVEITEMSGYDDFNSLRDFVLSMKNAGIHTSIDDFGTGYSSLNMLKDLKVDIVKLDKSFIDNIYDGDSEDDVVIKGIIDMVSKLNMKVVAEGAETKKQIDFLREAGCHMVQGYWFDKPLSKEDYEKRLRNKQYNNYNNN